MRLIKQASNQTHERGTHCYQVQCDSEEQARFIDNELRQSWSREWDACPAYDECITGAYYVWIGVVENFKEAYKAAKRGVRC